MNKAEKNLAQKILDHMYAQTRSSIDFSREENIIIDRWIVHGIANKEAFHEATPINSNHRQYLRGIGYPFTEKGDQEINKNWYLHIRNNMNVILLRDFFTLIAFIASLWLAILKVVSEWPK